MPCDARRPLGLTETHTGKRPVGLERALAGRLSRTWLPNLVRERNLAPEGIALDDWADDL